MYSTNKMSTYLLEKCCGKYPNMHMFHHFYNPLESTHVLPSLEDCHLHETHHVHTNVKTQLGMNLSKHRMVVAGKIPSHYHDCYPYPLIEEVSVFVPIVVVLHMELHICIELPAHLDYVYCFATLLEFHLWLHSLSELRSTSQSITW